MTDVLPDLAPRPVAVPSGGIEDSLRSPASFFAWLAFLTVATIAMFPLPVPSWSEHFYLITPLHVLDRGFLARDWTVANEYRTHLGFTYLAAGLIKLFGLQGAGWIGRVLTAVLVQSGLLRLGAQYAGDEMEVPLGGDRRPGAACLAGGNLLGKGVGLAPRLEDVAGVGGDAADRAREKCGRDSC